MAPVAVIGGAAEGISELHRIITGSEIRKWPLYLRQVKQMVRTQTPPFDERAYGFASLVDLLRAAHKEGAFRVERDRQGVIRVFQSGSAGLAASTTAAQTESPAVQDENVGHVPTPTDPRDEQQDAAVPEQDAATETADAPVETPAPSTKKPARRRAVKSEKPKATRPAAKKTARKTK